MGKILNILIAAVIVTSCNVTDGPKLSYDNTPGTELMLFENNDHIIDKSAVFHFQLESKNDTSDQYFDTGEKGVDEAKFRVKEKLNYSFRLDAKDSIKIEIFDDNNASVLEFEELGETFEVELEEGIYTFRVTNLKEQKGIRKIFYKPDYEMIVEKGNNNNNSEAQYSIISEDECRDCNLSEANLSGHSLKNVNFTNSDFSNSKLKSTELSGSILNYTKLFSIDADSADFTNCLIEEPSSMSHSTFQYLRAANIKITDADSKFSDFFDADFSNSEITGSNFNNSELFSCNFTSADLTDNSFQDVDLRFSTFDYADISGSDFCNSDLSDATFFNSIANNNTNCVPDSVSSD